MIEEASGTSLYETKREQTTKVIEKKDSKLKEMESVSEAKFSGTVCVCAELTKFV